MIAQNFGIGIKVLISFVIIFILAGCGVSSRKTTDGDEIIKLNSGVIIYKDNSDPFVPPEYETSNSTDAPWNIKFGPDDLKFGSKTSH
ncbi:MAG: hypothetical protein V2B14_06355 [bacterium]